MSLRAGRSDEPCEVQMPTSVGTTAARMGRAGRIHGFHVDREGLGL
jgi:hypothetical protein